MPLVASRWKSVGLLLLVTLAPPAVMLRGADLTDDSPREQAVSQYIDGATKELAAFDKQIGDAARPGNQQQCGEAKAKLDECTRLLTELKSADTEHFDLVKASYERTRGEMVKALQAAQSS